MLRLIAFLFVTGSALAQDEMEYFSHQPNSVTAGKIKVPEFKGGHSICHSVNGHITGNDIHRPVRLASVSKLITSYWALNVFGAHFKFKTLIGYNRRTKVLYINTQGDPFFSIQKLFLIISELNKRNITSLNQIELYKDSTFLPSVEHRRSRFTEYGVSGGPSQTYIAEKLLDIVNTSQWTDKTKSLFSRFKAEAQKRNIAILPALTFSAKKVSWTSRHQPTSWTISSSPLISYLKALNQYSMNYIGDRLFFLMGGKSAMESFLARDPDLNRDNFELYTGSGLNIGQNLRRVDNRASCFFVIKLLSKIASILKRNGIPIHHFFLAIGSEPGTLNPGPNSPWGGRLFAKTGTLRNAITLAGFLSTQKGMVPFGIFFQTNNKRIARSARNQIIDRWLEDFGVTKPYPVTPYLFFALPEGAQFQRN